jgi:8-oxo-dGTP pyrophosphatase MutT (NUDIX family)
VRRDLASARAVLPKDAATMIVVDRSGPTPLVLLGKRHARQAFMPGRFVFPGGGVDAADRSMPVAAPLHTDVEAKLMQRAEHPSAEFARALALAAVRETYEETGLMLGTQSVFAAPAEPGPWAAFAARGIQPDLSGVHFIARAITPPGFPRRFDARFFAIDASAIAHRQDGVVHADAELVELAWMPIREARRLPMPVITEMVLDDFEKRVHAGFGRELPVPFYHTDEDEGFVCEEL